MYLSDVFTVTCNIAGIPGLSLPCGFTAGDKPLPIGLQLLGPTFGEPTPSGRRPHVRGRHRLAHPPAGAVGGLGTNTARHRCERTRSRRTECGRAAFPRKIRLLLRPVELAP